MFTFDAITEVSKVTQRIVVKGENAGSRPASSDSKAVANMPVVTTLKRVLEIAKTQVRNEKKKRLEQRYFRAGGHLWESVNANMTWRVKFDNMSYDGQQTFIAEGKSRFCAGKHFGQYHLDPGKGGKGLRSGEIPGPRVRLQYGGGMEFLHGNEVYMSVVGREMDERKLMDLVPKDLHCWFLGRRNRKVVPLVYRGRGEGEMVQTEHGPDPELQGRVVRHSWRLAQTAGYLA